MCPAVKISHASSMHFLFIQQLLTLCEVTEDIKYVKSVTVENTPKKITNNKDFLMKLFIYKTCFNHFTLLLLTT